MDNTNKQGRGSIGLRVILGLATALLVAQSALAQTTITAVKMSPSGAKSDRVVIEFTGREPELAVSSAEGSLVVTLVGAKLADSVKRSQTAGASLSVIRSTDATAQGGAVELKVQTRVKAWSHSAMQSRRNVTIDLIAAAVQPVEETPAPIPVPVAVPAVVAATAAVAPVAAAEPAAEPAPEPTSRRREKTKACIECHEGFYSITKTKHYVRNDSRTPGSKGSEQSAAECEACHGDLTAHQKTPRVKGLVPITYGKQSPAELQNETCLNCHQGGTRIHWQGSAHDRAKQSCASCHRMHAAKDPVLVNETQASVCFDCHKDRRAEMHRVSTHPTKTGFISCSSCHASHGSNTRASLQKASVNQTCFQCHADKRGPFLWEHRSASDDCTNCHNPHGTNNPPMLKVRTPFLCQQCHASTGHSNQLFSGSTATISDTSGSHRMLGRSCTNCHSKVHGSNHPSGARLQR
jgi:DmsE family decaheme c-type cytochrome